MENELDDVHFGDVEAAPIDWRAIDVGDEDDDEQLEASPDDVVAMLGFDPLDIDTLDA